MFPDVFTNISRIIKPIAKMHPMIPQQGERPLGVTGGGIGAVPQQLQQQPANRSGPEQDREPADESAPGHRIHSGQAIQYPGRTG